jgi:microcystin degradation protein MlrC
MTLMPQADVPVADTRCSVVPVRVRFEARKINQQIGNEVFTVQAVGHPTVFTYTDRVDAGIHANILEGVGYTVIIREAVK